MVGDGDGSIQVSTQSLIFTSSLLPVLLTVSRSVLSPPTIHKSLNHQSADARRFSIYYVLPLHSLQSRLSAPSSILVSCLFSVHAFPFITNLIFIILNANAILHIYVYCLYIYIYITLLLHNLQFTNFFNKLEHWYTLMYIHTYSVNISMLCAHAYTACIFYIIMYSSVEHSNHVCYA